MIRLTEVVKHLIIINVIMFVIAQLPMAFPMELYYFESDKFRPYQLATYFFMHGSIGHIFFNMFALAMFGPALETQMGSRRFLVYYIFTALFAAAFQFAVNYYQFHGMDVKMAEFAANPTYQGFMDYFGSGLSKYNFNFGSAVKELANKIDTDPALYVDQGVEVMNMFKTAEMNIGMVGASGALFGVMIAFAYYYPNVELMLIFLPIPIKAKYFIPIMMVMELFLGYQNFSWDNVAHFAHLGGAIGGFLLIKFWEKFPELRP